MRHQLFGISLVCVVESSSLEQYGRHRITGAFNPPPGFPIDFDFLAADGWGWSRETFSLEKVIPPMETFEAPPQNIQRRPHQQFKANDMAAIYNLEKNEPGLHHSRVYDRLKGLISMSDDQVMKFLSKLRQMRH